MSLLQNNLGKYVVSALGVLFYGVAVNGRVIARKFHDVVTTSKYVEIVSAIRDWLDSRPELLNALEIWPLLEVGEDFVLRQHGIYTSTDEMLEEEGRIEIPDAFWSARNAIDAALTGATDGRGAIVERVIRNSALLPTGKTFFNFSSNKIVVVEPRISEEDIRSW